jgi:hypothetical protein
MVDVAKEATMRELNRGRWLGVAWCCTVDERGTEHDVAFGWTRQQAERRCLHKMRLRITASSDAAAGLAG